MDEVRFKQLEDNVDKLLLLQIRMNRYIKIKTVISVITFVVMIVIPIVLVFFVGQYIQEILGLTGEEMGETLRRVKSITEFGGVEGIKELLNK